MKNTDLATLGQKIARLRINKNLKQSELAYESGISERTLQRIEAGDIVKTDGLLNVLRQLNKLEEFLSVLNEPGLSPIAVAKQASKHAQQKSRVRKTQEKPSNNQTSHSTKSPEDHQ
jgi:transcriptional regulator with XRE-family HTH domain